jgi:5-methylcytosine-specific restriction endonuclease McrA
MNRKEVECVICKKIFTAPAKVGNIPKHCSNECRRESRLISLNKYAEKTRLKELRCCPICGDSFIAEGQCFRGQRYCSDKCARRAENNKRNERRMDNAQISECPQCRKTFKNRPARTYCSYECYIESRRPLEQTSKCPICGQEFNQRGCRLKYCSLLCSAKAQAEVYRRNTTTRRALRVTNGRVERIDAKAIFQRDGWRCQLCGKKVEKRLYKTKGTKRYANAPSLDHIIPISRGGEHTRTNVQCACYLCNCKKGNRTSDGGDQLRLFG